MNDIVPPPAFTTRLVRELKGAPLACLVLLMLSETPVSNEWLCRMSGYTDKPISQAMKLLSGPEHQIARRARGGWALSKSFQLALAVDKSRNISVPTTTTNVLILNNNDSEVVVAGRKYSESDEDPAYLANLEACRAVGIGEPSASVVSGLEHVTADFIMAHVKGLRKGDQMGLAILRIKNNEAAPDVIEVEEMTEAPRYLGGAYASYFEVHAEGD